MLLNNLFYCCFDLIKMKSLGKGGNGSFAYLAWVEYNVLDQLVFAVDNTMTRLKETQYIAYFIILLQVSNLILRHTTW
jgi:hypothetical protein